MDDNQKNTNSTDVNATADVSSSAPAPDSSLQGVTSGSTMDPAIAELKDAISKNDTMQNAFTNAANSMTANDTDITTQMAEKIIREQEGIIGPVAYEQATKVPGISIDKTNHNITLNGDKKIIVENLVKQYEQLFGKISIAICKEAVRGIIINAPADQVPQILL